MELGAATARYWGPGKDLQSVLNFISDYFKVAELWVEPPFYPAWRTSREKAELDRLQDVLVATDLETTIHAPHHDLCLCSWNPAVNSLTQKEIRKSLDMASELNSSAVTFHPGRARLNEEFCKDTLRYNLEVLNDLASEYSPKLCLENPHEGFFAGLDLLLELTGDLKNIYLTLDLAHLSLQKTELRRHKSKVRRKVKNVHLSGITADGRHKPLLKETMFIKDSLKTLQDAGYRGAVILEGAVEGKPEEITIKEVRNFRGMIKPCRKAAR